MTNFRRLIMAPKSTAERWKKYRQKHKQVYWEKDALRKRNYYQKMKANPIVNDKKVTSSATEKTKISVASQRQYSYCYCRKILWHSKTMTLLFWPFWDIWPKKIKNIDTFKQLLPTVVNTFFRFYIKQYCQFQGVDTK